MIRLKFYQQIFRGLDSALNFTMNRQNICDICTVAQSSRKGTGFWQTLERCTS